MTLKFDILPLLLVLLQGTCLFLPFISFNYQWTLLTEGVLENNLKWHIKPKFQFIFDHEISIHIASNISFLPKYILTGQS